MQHTNSSTTNSKISTASSKVAATAGALGLLVGAAALPRMFENHAMDQATVVGGAELRQALAPDFNGKLKVQEPGGEKLLPTFAIVGQASGVQTNRDTIFMSSIHYRAEFSLQTSDPGLPVQVQLIGNTSRNLSPSFSGPIKLLVESVQVDPNRPGTVLLTCFHGTPLSPVASPEVK